MTRAASPRGSNAVPGQVRKKQPHLLREQARSTSLNPDHAGNSAGLTSWVVAYTASSIRRRSLAGFCFSFHEALPSPGLQRLAAHPIAAPQRLVSSRFPDATSLRQQGPPLRGPDDAVVERPRVVVARVMAAGRAFSRRVPAGGDRREYEGEQRCGGRRRTVSQNGTRQRDACDNTNGRIGWPRRPEVGEAMGKARRWARREHNPVPGRTPSRLVER